MTGEGERSEALRFALVGTHNAGKTTICHDVTARLMRRGVRAALAPEPSRTSTYLAGGVRGVPAQVDLFARTVANEMEACRGSEVVICDRSLVDVLAYTDALPVLKTEIEQLHRAAMLAFAEKYVLTYTAIFKTGWRFSMEASSDPLREGDDSFQSQIDSGIDGYLDRLGPLVIPLPNPDVAAQEIEECVIQHLEDNPRSAEMEWAL